MDKVISKLRRIAAFIGLCCLWAYLLFTFIAAIGQMAEGAGAGSFIAWYIIVAFIGLLSFAFFAKKQELLKILVILLLAYYAMRSVFGAAAAFTFGAEGVLLAYQIFNLFAVLCLLAAFVLFLLQSIFPSLKGHVVLRIITYALLGGHIFFLFVGWILYTIGMAQYGEYTWFMIIDGIGTMLFIPCAFLFGYMYFNEEGEDEHPFKKKAKVEKKEESKAEEPKEEVEAAPAEEKPAE